jgi:hypothetical protein
LGGKYGSEKSRIYDINYLDMAKFDRPKKLFTGTLKMPLISSRNVYEREVYIEHFEPISFNILSITQDINVSDA